MIFNTFCNICFTKENIIKLYGEENETLLNILISFTSCPDIVNGIIYLCINCCNKLEEYDNFRELCLTNFVRFQYLYKEYKKQLEIRNAPDIEIQLKAFVDVNVERPSGTPLIENYEAAQALANNITCNLDITYKKESDAELTKIEWDELLNQNNLSHADISFSPENEDQEINRNSVVKNEPNEDRFEESQNQLACDRVAKASTCHESADAYTSDVPFTKTDLDELLKQNHLRHADNSIIPEHEDQEIKGSSVVKNEPNADRFEESKDQLVCDAVATASPCHESAYACTSDVSFKPEDCVTDNSTDEEEFTDNENKSKTSDTVCNVCDGSLPCDKCHTTFTDTANIHKRLPSDERPYKCDECSLRFKHQCHLKTHKRKHTGEKPYKCDECGLGFTTRSYLQVHRRRHTGEKPYKCDECGSRFAHVSHLNRHKIIHTGEKPYKCDECGATFAERTTLNRHKLIHTGEKPYKCDECGLRFTQSSTLNIHKRLHTGEKPYKCDECGSIFTQLANLNRHKLIHTGEKPYKCDVCGSSFAERFRLNRHKRTHTGEKPYICDECGSKFGDRFHLNKHKLIHTGERPYSCDECGSTFSQRSHLNKHKLIHTREKPYKCDKCDYRFAQRSHLYSHKLGHTDDLISSLNTLYNCDECDYRCTRRYDLKTHKRSHTGEKPYKCDECDLGFTKRSYLSKHKLTHAEKTSLCSA